MNVLLVVTFNLSPNTRACYTFSPKVNGRYCNLFLYNYLLLSTKGEGCRRRIWHWEGNGNQNIHFFPWPEVTFGYFTTVKNGLLIDFCSWWKWSWAVHKALSVYHWRRKQLARECSVLTRGSQIHSVSVFTSGKLGNPRDSVAMLVSRPIRHS